jgi:O-antigen/teichoic acid export membrane protein
MRAKRSFLNLGFGIGSQLITMALGIIIPRLFLVNFGSEVNGLVQSISQIIVYFSLFEAGVGAATLQALYKPVVNGDKSRINEILSATSIYYKKTGIFYFLAVLVLSILYPLIIKSHIDKTTIMLVILFSGLGGAINYYFQGKFRIFLSAEGKDYIVTFMTTIINILSNVAKIVLLLCGFNIIVVQASFFILTIVQVILFQIYISKNYKWINIKVKPDYNSISQKNSVLVHQFSTLIFNNTDVLILTIFTNLKVVSIYVMYNMLFNMIENIINSVKGSFTFVLGQTFHENKEKFLKLYDIFEVYLMVFVFSLFTVTFILVLPFLRIYTSGINDINYIDKWIPILFVAVKLLVHARSAGNNLINIAGHFKKTQYRSLLESLINLTCSLIFVNILGIYGVLLGTLVAVLYRTIDIMIYSNKILLGRGSWPTFKRLISNVAVFLLIITFINHIDIQTKSYLLIMLKGIVLTVVVFPVYFIIASLVDRKIFLTTWGVMNRFIHKFFRKFVYRKI